MPDHYLLTATEAKFVTNKPHTLIIVCEQQRYECMIKISEAKIKRRSNDTQVIESHSLSSDVSINITSTSWMYSVRTKGGKTAGRPPQQYIQMKRMGVYRITTVYDVTSVSLRVGDITYELPHWTPEEHTIRMASLPTSPTSRSRAVMPREQYLHECKETTPIRRGAEGELPHQPRNKKMKVEVGVKVEEKVEHVMIPTTSSTWIPSSEHTSPVSTASTPSTSEMVESTPMSYGLDFQLASVSQAPDQLWYTVPSSHIHGLLSPHYPNHNHHVPLFSDEVEGEGYNSMLEGWKPSEQIDDFVGSLFAPLSPVEDQNMGMDVHDMTNGLQVDVSPQSIASPSPSSSPTSPGISQPPVTRSFSSLSFSSDSDLSLEEQLDQRLDELVDSVVGTGDMGDVGMNLLDHIQDMQSQAYVFQAQVPVEYTPPQVQTQQASQVQEAFVFYPPIQPVMQPQFASIQQYVQVQDGISQMVDTSQQQDSSGLQIQMQQQMMVQSFSPGPSLIPQQQVQMQVHVSPGQAQSQQQQVQVQASPGTGTGTGQPQQQTQAQISPGIQQQQIQQHVQVQASPGTGQISPDTQQQEQVQVQVSPGTGTGQQQQVQHVQVQVSPGQQEQHQQVQVQVSPGTGTGQQVQVHASSGVGTGTGTDIGMVFQQQLAISPTLQTSPTPSQIISVSSGGDVSSFDGLQTGLGVDTSQHNVTMEVDVSTSPSQSQQQVPLHDTSQYVSSQISAVIADMVTQQSTGFQSPQVTTHDTSQLQSITQVSTRVTTASQVSADSVMQRVSMVDTSTSQISIPSMDGSNVVSQPIPRATRAQQFMSTMLALSILPNVFNMGTRDNTDNQHSRNDHDDQHSQTVHRTVDTDVDVTTYPYASDGTHVMMETSQPGYQQQQNRTSSQTASQQQYYHDTNVVSSQSQSQAQSQSQSVSQFQSQSQAQAQLQTQDQQVQFQTQDQQVQFQTQVNGGNYQHVYTMVPSLEDTAVRREQFTQQSQVQDSIQMVSQRSSQAQVQDIQQSTQRSSQSSQVRDIQQAIQLDISNDSTMASSSQQSSQTQSSQAERARESMVGIIQDTIIKTIVCMIDVLWMICLYIACWISYLHNMLFPHVILQVSQSIAQSQNQSPSLAVTALIPTISAVSQAQVQAQASVSQQVQSPGLAVTALISPLTTVSQVQAQANISQQVQAQTSISQDQSQVFNGLLQESIISGAGSGVDAVAVSETSIPMFQDTAASTQIRPSGMILLSPLSLSSPLISQVQAQTSVSQQVQAQTSISQQVQAQISNVQESIISDAMSGAAVDTASAPRRSSTMMLLSPLSLSSPLVQATTGSQVVSIVDVVLSSVFSSVVLDSPSLPMLQTDISSQDMVLQSSSQSSSQVSSSSTSQSQATSISSMQASTTQVDTSLSTSAPLLPIPRVHTSQETHVYDSIEQQIESYKQQIELYQQQIMKLQGSMLMISINGDERIDDIDIQQQSSTDIQYGESVDLPSIPLQTQVSMDQPISHDVLQQDILSMVLVSMMMSCLSIMSYGQMKQDEDGNVQDRDIQSQVINGSMAIDTQQQQQQQQQQQSSVKTHNDELCPDLHPFTLIPTQVLNMEDQNRTYDSAILLISYVISSYVIGMMSTYVISNTWQQSFIHSYQSSVRISTSSRSTPTAVVSSHVTSSSSQMPSSLLTVDAIYMILSLCVNLDTSLPSKSLHSKSKSSFNSSHQQPFLRSNPSIMYVHDPIIVTRPAVVAA